VVRLQKACLTEWADCNSVRWRSIRVFGDPNALYTGRDRRLVSVSCLQMSCDKSLSSNSARAAPGGTRPFFSSSKLALTCVQRPSWVTSVWFWWSSTLWPYSYVTCCCALSGRHAFLCRQDWLTVCCSCGVPLFSNATTTICKQCNTVVTLSINPRLVPHLLFTPLIVINLPC